MHHFSPTILHQLQESRLYNIHKYRHTQTHYKKADWTTYTNTDTIRRTTQLDELQENRLDNIHKIYKSKRFQQTIHKHSKTQQAKMYPAC